MGSLRVALGPVAACRKAAASIGNRLGRAILLPGWRASDALHRGRGESTADRRVVAMRRDSMEPRWQPPKPVPRALGPLRLRSSPRPQRLLGLPGSARLFQTVPPRRAGPRA